MNIYCNWTFTIQMYVNCFHVSCICFPMSMLLCSDQVPIGSKLWNYIPTEVGYIQQVCWSTRCNKSMGVQITNVDGWKVNWFWIEQFPCLASMEIVQFFKEILVSNPGETRLHAVVFLVFWYHLIDAVSLITQWMKKQLMRDIAHNIEEVHSEADGSELLGWWCLEGCDSTICVMLDLMVAELIQKWVPSKFHYGVLCAIPYIHLFSDGFSGWNASKS